MNPGLAIWLRAFLIAFNLISLLILGNPFGLLELLLDYPAQGEEEANRNLSTVFLVILPTVQFICYFISLIFQNYPNRETTFRRVSEPAIWLVLLFGFLTAFIASHFKDPSQLKPVIFFTVVLIVYSGILHYVWAVWQRARRAQAP